VFTVGHGARPGEELVEVLREAEVETVVDVRRFPGSRRHPQFNREALEASIGEAGIAYAHTVELGGRLSGEPGEDAFDCIRVAAFRSYAARMRTAAWQSALEQALVLPGPCFLCAETLWWRCHRRLIAELLEARGHEVVHLLKPGHSERHRPWEPISEVRDGVLHLCGEPVA
jgi:uncharacterized protein (DUF488 family)